ncbi:GNAT family N-acetyltransferase [Schumannella soli]|uniref:GNAT family N-acetyltransferase n=1 Tax=Schumannella soli TaxID=2590779 RepID=A0A506YCN7_9MICO|nr:GNAT family N-acetyltransferase [Schumannella soli]TPW78219.1 GNAT family N-acetyltransferase [Schumannella soli]
MLLSWRAPVDDAELSRLHAEAFAHPAGVEPWADRLDRHSIGWATARQNGALVGFVNVVGDGGAHAFLVDTVVAPALQGGGIGRQLVALAVAETRATGAAWLHVDYEPHLEGFYRQAGFGPTHAGLIALT